MIRAIFSCDSFGGIGYRNNKPWDHQSEKDWFKSNTENGTLVMGRVTWDSQKNSEPLSKNTQIVITNKILLKSGVVCYNHDWQRRVKDFAAKSDSDIWIVGGKQILEDSRDILDEIYITRVKGKYYSDVIVNLPRFLDGWRLSRVKPGDAACTFEVWKPWIKSHTIA